MIFRRIRNEDYHKIFKMIDADLWSAAQRPCVEGKEERQLPTTELRKLYTAKSAERMKGILTAYIDSSAEKVSMLITDERFARFPLPRTKRSLVWKLRCQLRFWKTMCVWRLRGGAVDELIRELCGPEP